MGDRFPERTRARNADRDRRINEQNARDAKRNTPKESEASKKAIDQMFGIQSAMSVQQVDAQLLTRLAVIERRTQTLETANRGLLTRAPANTSPRPQPQAETSHECRPRHRRDHD